MTDKLRAAAEAALKAFEVATTPLAKDRQEVLQAREALRAALAEPEVEQEPVAWMDDDGHLEWNKKSWMDDRYFPVYRRPPRRKWVGLTDEEIRAVIEPLVSQPNLVDALMLVSIDEYRAIEAALKERNT